MEKKNTMLLTTIAVATLLITVVGATFAYFGVTLQNDSETVSINGKATEVGIVTVTTPVKAMHLNLTGTEMSKDNEYSVYYASATESVPFYKGTFEYGYDESGNIASTRYYNSTLYVGNTNNTTNGAAVQYNVFDLSVVGGDSNVEYNCSTQITVNKTNEDTMIAKTVAEDLEMSYETVYDYKLDDAEPVSVGKSVDLISSNFTNNAMVLNLDLPVLTAGSTFKILVNVRIKNTPEVQNFANTVLDLEIKVNSITCKIKGN